MSSQTSAPMDPISPPPNKRRRSKCSRSVQPPTQSNHNLNDHMSSSSRQPQTDGMPESKSTKYSIPRITMTQHTPVHAPGDIDPQLALILAKLNELDAIKLHLHAIDNRLDTIQTPSEKAATVAKRS